jgi:hypothetical protein
MNGDIKVYKPKKSVVGGGLIALAIVFFGLTLPLIVAGVPVEKGKLIGLSGFWILGIIMILIPLTARLEVGGDCVKMYFLGFKTRTLKATNIEVLEYSNLFRGGLGAGKAIKGWEKTGSGHKYFSIGEGYYGKEAIAHAKKVLDPKA